MEQVIVEPIGDHMPSEEPSEPRPDLPSEPRPDELPSEEPLDLPSDLPSEEPPDTLNKKSSPKKRGRPPKPKPENPPQKKPVGRPKGSKKKESVAESLPEFSPSVIRTTQLMLPSTRESEDQSLTFMRMLLDRKRLKMNGKAERYRNLLRL